MPKVYSTSPYYDDFDQTKKFYRILFRPGRAVQARELTQLQTILQNQIEQFGNNVFKDGSKVSGGQPFFLTGNYVKIQETSDITAFEGAKVTGQTSGAKATVKKISKSFTANSVVYPAALHFVYNTGTTFEKNESITIDGTITSVTTQIDDTYSGTSYFASVTSGIYYVKGYFVYTDAQTALVTATFLENPSAIVGFKAVESVVTSEDDASLLDPAVGTNNYFAPGADRYSIDLKLTSYEYDADVAGSISTATTGVDFIKVINIEKGKIISVNEDTSYNEIERFVARRTSDESGDYTVTPFVAKVENHRYGNVDLFSLDLSPGKAYVKGYAFETIAPSFLDIEKARTVDSTPGYPIDLSYGRNLSVQNVTGYPNFTESQQVQLFSVKANTVSSSNAYVYFAKPFVGSPNFLSAGGGNSYVNSYLIGNARVRFINPVDASSNTDPYNLYLFDLNLKAGNSFSEVKSFVAANIMIGANITLFSANVVSSSPSLNYTRDDTYLSPIPQQYIKTFKPGASSNTTSLAYKSFDNISFSTSGGWSNATITLTGTDNWSGSGKLSDLLVNTNFYVSVTSASGNPPYVGNVLSFAGASGNVFVYGQTVLLSYKAGQNFVANVVGLVSTTTAEAKTKTLANANVRIYYTSNTNANLSEIKLFTSDVFAIKSIKDSNNTSYLGYYNLDTGQRDDYYNHGRLLFTGNTADTNATVTINSTNPYLNVEFSYFEHTGTGFFNVDSYSNFSWDAIPLYTTTTGKKIRLSDVIDYRPVRSNFDFGGDYTLDTRFDGMPNANTILFNNQPVPSPVNKITATLYYYLPRRDKVVLTKDRKFVLVKGVPSKAPGLPSDQDDAMTLYVLDVMPFTATPSDVILNYINNKRYTMRDIGRLDKRVQRLEYYTTLSFLEKIAADERVPSAVPGIDRFKNGILVDSFAGHNVSDVSNPDLRCSMDFENRFLRPRFSTGHVLYTLYSNGSNNYVKEGDLVTINYDPFAVMEQTKATGFVNVSPFEVFNYVGRITLDPATDIWKDTVTNPKVVTNLLGDHDYLSQMTLDKTGLTSNGMVYSDYKSLGKNVTGVSVNGSVSTEVENTINVDGAGNMSIGTQTTSSLELNTKVTKSESFVASGLEMFTKEKVIETSIGSSVVDSSLLPYIRSRPVKFVAQNLKPETSLVALFDNVEVTDYCYQTSRLVLTNPSSNIPSANVIRTYSGATVYSEGNVIFQKANVIYYQQNNQTYPFVTGNVVSVFTPDGPTLTGQIISSVSIADNGTLTTDQFGIVAGIFYIPNDQTYKFNVGERAFKLSDSPDDVLATTAAETKYLALGSTNTTQESVISTRLQTTSLTPLINVQKGKETTDSQTANDSKTTSSTSNTVTLPKDDPEIADDLTIKQTFFCGEQTPQASGGIGQVAYKVNLGTRVGAANITFTTGVVPDRATVLYNGEERTTGFISNATGTKLAEYNKRIETLGFPAVTGASPRKLEFIKQKQEAEELIIKVDAPLKETRWSFKVDCPAGVTTPAAGTGVLNSVTTNLHVPKKDTFTNTIYGTTRSKLYFTGEVDVALGYTIVNTASNPRFTFPGTPADKSITITNIEIYYPTANRPYNTEAQLAKQSGTVSLEFDSGQLVVGAGTVFPRYDNKLTFPLKGFPQTVSQKGGLPLTLAAGEKVSFAMRVKKPINGSHRAVPFIKVTAQGPNGEPVTMNEKGVNIVTHDQFGGDPYDPLAQTFFISAGEYGQGVFVSSIDLWFRKKATTTPIIVEIRPVTASGTPSGFDVMPFSQALIYPEDITASTTFNKDNYTRCKFPSPVYLQPGKYCFVVLADSVDYELYSATLGEFELNDPTSRIVKQPYIGALFKSQNASSWVEEPNEDLTFRMNICDFGDTSNATISLYAENTDGTKNYDVFYSAADLLTFPDTTLSTAFKTTDNATGLTETIFRNYLIGYNYPMESRKLVTNNLGNQLQFKFELGTINRYVAPIVDLNRLGSVLVRNIINDPENETTPRTLDEDQYTGGNADARYITRKVILNPGFEAQDIKVLLNAYLPNPSRIKVFYKVNAPGTIDFDGQNKWVELTTVSIVGDPLTGFAEHSYSTASGSVFADQAYFSTFQLKVVMLSTDPTKVPLIKDFRAMALEAP